ncbi:MAG TPA: SMC-Scp complex subunit ScpB [Chloroflexota bacterium]|nr:SMC-Scp complex subunit ScpB [Chloroflexota bacterium]
MPPPAPDDGRLSALASVLLVAGGPVKIGALAEALQCSRREVSTLLDALELELTAGIRLQRQLDEVQLTTAPENADVIQRFLGAAHPPALTRASLEVLTIVAYHQPVTRAEVEAMRGVNSDRAIQTLLSRDLIEERGQRPVLGRPMEYGTSFRFLEYFGLTSLDDLPPLPDAESAQHAPDVGIRR